MMKAIWRLVMMKLKMKNYTVNMLVGKRMKRNYAIFNNKKKEKIININYIEKKLFL